ncbi:MAG: hypothetical protein OCC49_07370 [Fibrobacterales bacterium]
MKQKLLSDIDMQLFLARALPWYKRLFIRILLLLSPELQKQYSKIAAENTVFMNREQPRLHQSLFEKNSTRAPIKNSSPFLAPWFKPAISFATVALIALPMITTYMATSTDSPDQPYYAAKGSGLGVSLFKKEREYTLLSDAHVNLNILDTLQLMPMGTSSQFVALYTLHNNKLSRIYPENTKTLVLFNEQTLPPSLIFDGDTTRLIAVTATIPHALTKVEQIITGFSSDYNQTPPLSHLVDSIYIQPFLITLETSHD